MGLSNREIELIAVGASITANCQPCLRSHIEKALASGADKEDVVAAMEVGNRVKKGAAAKMDFFSRTLLESGAPQCCMGAVMEGNGRQFLGP